MLRLAPCIQGSLLKGLWGTIWKRRNQIRSSACKASPYPLYLFPVSQVHLFMIVCGSKYLPFFFFCKSNITNGKTGRWFKGLEPMPCHLTLLALHGPRAPHDPVPPCPQIHKCKAKEWKEITFPKYHKGEKEHHKWTTVKNKETSNSQSVYLAT